jgi:hypothetical protein
MRSVVGRVSVDFEDTLPLRFRHRQAHGADFVVLRSSRDLLAAPSPTQDTFGPPADAMARSTHPAFIITGRYKVYVRIPCSCGRYLLPERESTAAFLLGLERTSPICNPAFDVIDFKFVSKNLI